MRRPLHVVLAKTEKPSGIETCWRLSLSPLAFQLGQKLLMPSGRQAEEKPSMTAQQKNNQVTGKSPMGSMIGRQRFASIAALFSITEHMDFAKSIGAISTILSQ